MTDEEYKKWSWDLHSSDVDQDTRLKAGVEGARHLVEKFDSILELVPDNLYDKTMKEFYPTIKNLRTFLGDDSE